MNTAESLLRRASERSLAALRAEAANGTASQLADLLLDADADEASRLPLQ